MKRAPAQLEVEHVAPASLLAYERNHKTHPEEQIAALCLLILEVGFLVPVLVDEHGVLIAGHGRQEAALRLRLETIPCIRASGLSPAQVRAMRIADNQIGMGAGNDLDALGEEVRELCVEGFDLSSLGFTDEYLAALIEENASALDRAEVAMDAALMRDQPAPAKRTGRGASSSAAQLGELVYRVVVEVADESAQGELLERLEGEGFKCSPLIS